MAFAFLRRSSSKVLEELEADFLAPLERCRSTDVSTKPVAPTSAFRQWFRRTSTRLDSWKEDWTMRLVCCSHKMLDDQEDLEDLDIFDQKTRPAPMKRASSRRAATIAPIPVPAKTEEDSADEKPRHEAPGVLVDISYVLLDSVQDDSRRCFNVDDEIKEDDDQVSEQEECQQQQYHDQTSDEDQQLVQNEDDDDGDDSQVQQCGNICGSSIDNERVKEDENVNEVNEIDVLEVGVYEAGKVEDDFEETSQESIAMTDVSAARLLQRAFRRHREQRAAISSTPACESVSCHDHFSRVRMALKCIFAWKKLADERKTRAAITIQHRWTRFRRSRETDIPVQMLRSSGSSRRKRLRSVDETRQAQNDWPTITFSIEDDDELDEELGGYCEESNVVVSELVQHSVDMFVIPRCVSVIPPSSACKPRAIKAQSVINSQAACVIQSAWRCVLAKQHAQALRRLTVYEQERHSVMPAIRTQMNTIRQRLEALKSRDSSSSSDIEFDESWL